MTSLKVILVTMSSSEMDAALDEATALAPTWSCDECQPGVVYRLGSDETKRVSLLTCMFIKAITRGIGLKAKWDRESERAK